MQVVEIYTDATVIEGKESQTFNFLPYKDKSSQKDSHLGIGSSICRVKYPDSREKHILFKGISFYPASNSFDSEVLIAQITISKFLTTFLNSSLKGKPFTLKWVCDIPYMSDEIKKSGQTSQSIIQLKETISALSSCVDFQTTLGKTSRDLHYHHLCHRQCYKQRLEILGLNNQIITECPHSTLCKADTYLTHCHFCSE